MKFSLLPLSILVSTVIADGASIIAAIEKISNATVALNTTVATFPSSFLGGAVDVVPLLVDSTALLDDINSGTYVASSSANLSLAETISVAGATTSLVSTVESVLDTVVAAKAKFDKLLIVSPVILVNLKLEKAATDKFSAAVISKVPTAYQALAETIVAPVDVAFDNAIADYE